MPAGASTQDERVGIRKETVPPGRTENCQPVSSRALAEASWP